MTAPLQPILDLFDQLQQTNSYVKVVGNPTFSVSAILNEEIKAIKPNDTVLIKTLNRIKGSMDLLHDKSAQLAWWRPRKIQGITQDLDQAALNWAYNDGYLPTAPTAIVVPEKNILNMKRVPALYMELTDEVRIVGDNEGKLNLERYIQEGISKKTDINVALDTSMMEENANISRLFVLFHEASHHVFSHIKSPFIPPKGFDVKAADCLNDWVFNSLVKNTAGTAFNEIFADTYGAMMLLRGLDFSKKSIETVREFAILRIEMDAISHISKQKSFKQQLMSYVQKSGNVHVGGNTVLKLLDQIDQWKNLDLNALKQEALRRSSEGLVQWLLPHHVNVHIDGKHKQMVKPGHRETQLIVADMPTFDTAVTGVIKQSAVATSARNKSAHPCQDDIDFIANTIQSQLNKKNPNPSMAHNGILPVFMRLLSVMRKSAKILIQMKKDKEHPYHQHADHYNKKCEQAADVIKKGFHNFYHARGPVDTQVVSLKGKEIKQ